MASARLHASQPARPLVLSVTRPVRTNNDLILSEEKNKEDCCKRLSSFVCVAKYIRKMSGEPCLSWENPGAGQ